MKDWIEDESLTREEKLARFDALLARGGGVELSIARGLRQASVGATRRLDHLMEEEQ